MANTLSRPKGPGFADPQAALMPQGNAFMQGQRPSWQEMLDRFRQRPQIGGMPPQLGGMRLPQMPQYGQYPPMGGVRPMPGGWPTGGSRPQPGQVGMNPMIGAGQPINAFLQRPGSFQQQMGAADAAYGNVWRGVQPQQPQMATTSPVQDPYAGPRQLPTWKGPAYIRR